MDAIGELWPPPRPAAPNLSPIYPTTSLLPCFPIYCVAARAALMTVTIQKNCRTNHRAAIDQDYSALSFGFKAMHGRDCSPDAAYGLLAGA